MLGFARARAHARGARGRYGEFDAVATQHSLFHVETLGEAYMVSTRVLPAPVKYQRYTSRQYASSAAALCSRVYFAEGVVTDAHRTSL